MTLIGAADGLQPPTIFRVVCLVAAILVGISSGYISVASASTSRMTNIKLTDLLHKNGAAINATDEEAETSPDGCRRAHDSQNSEAVLQVNHALGSNQVKTKRDQ